MTRDEPDSWRDELETRVGDGGGCAEAWEASTGMRRGDSPGITRRQLLGSLGTAGAMSLAGCLGLGPGRRASGTAVDAGSQPQTPLSGTDSRTPGPSQTPAQDETDTGSDAPETETATADRPELAKLLVHKYAETEEASFEVQFIPVTNSPHLVADLELATDEFLERQEKRRFIARGVPHELDTTQNLVRIYQSAGWGDASPTMQLKLKQVERLRNRMCTHEADIWAAYVQQGQYEGKDGQYLLVAKPSDFPDLPCSAADTREWIAKVVRTNEPDAVEPAPVLNGELFWAPEWKVACAFVGAHSNWADDDAEEAKLRRDIALYEKLNGGGAAFANRTRFYDGHSPETASGGSVRTTARAASSPVHKPGDWRIDVALCNRAYQGGQVLNDPAACTGKGWSKPVVHQEYPRAYLKQDLASTLGKHLIARYRAYADEQNVTPCDGMCREAFDIADCLVSANLILWLDWEWDGGGTGTVCGSLSDATDATDMLWEGRCSDWSEALMERCGGLKLECWEVERLIAVGGQDHQAVLITPLDVDGPTDADGEKYATVDEFGMVYDPWRTEGRPFWIPAQRDGDWNWGIVE